MKTNIQEKLRANKEAWIDMLHILRRSLYTIFTDKGVLIVFFVACLVYPMVCGYIYNHEVMTDMPVAVVDKSNTALSREYIRRVDATPEVRIARSCESLLEAQNLQRHSQVHGIIYIPEDFSTSINTKRQTTVSIYADVTSFFWYRNLALASSSVSLTMGGEIQAKNRIAAGEMYDQAVSQVQPFKPTQHVLYNPGGYPFADCPHFGSSTNPSHRNRNDDRKSYRDEQTAHNDTREHPLQRIVENNLRKSFGVVHYLHSHSRLYAHNRAEVFQSSTVGR